MSDDARWLDGNALGGLLGELLGADVTAQPRDCLNCGEVNAVGAHRLYQGAGLVLRCPGCSAVALRVVTVAGGHRLRFEGAWTLDIPDR